MWPDGCQLKIPVTPSGIEPATFQFVVQCLNRLHHHVPLDVITPESYSCGHAQSAVSYKHTSDFEQKYIDHYRNVSKSQTSDASAYIRFYC